MSNTAIYESLGTRVAARRRGLDLTQAELAARTGMSRASIANIENGRQNVLLHHVYALALALELDKVSDLLPMQPKAALGETSISGSTVTPKSRAQIEDLIASALARQAPKVGS